MTGRQIIDLILVSAIWGASFMFMKILAPIFGPIFTSSLRLLIASLFLYIYFLIIKEKVSWKAYWKWYIIIGLLNSAIPFVLYSYAALNIPSSLSVILNSTAPMFGLVFGVMIISEKVTIQKVVGLFISSLGVVILSQVQKETADLAFYLSILACLGSTTLYGLSGALIKKYAKSISPKHLTLGSMFFGGILLAPLAIWFPIVQHVEVLDILYLVIFAVVGTAIAYLIYFKLISEVGPVKALMATYLMPVFGIFYSVTLLHETITIYSVLGLIVILSGIYLITSRNQLMKLK